MAASCVSVAFSSFHSAAGVRRDVEKHLMDKVFPESERFAAHRSFAIFIGYRLLLEHFYGISFHRTVRTTFVDKTAVEQCALCPFFAGEKCCSI
uniref:Putative secreted peptide n=1 Tax=Anopheles braziliensis TaxID=58242 RepID=A0A2M3ZX24_9DIPT